MAVPIRGLIPGMALHFAGCCHPLPGDRIVGIVTTGKGVTIHTIDCDTLDSFADDAGTLARCRLEQRARPTRRISAGINVTIANEPGNLGSLTTTIGKQGGNISNLKITNRSTDFFEIMVDIEVADVKHLSTSSRRCARRRSSTPSNAPVIECSYLPRPTGEVARAGAVYSALAGGGGPQGR